MAGRLTTPWRHLACHIYCHRRRIRRNHALLLLEEDTEEEVELNEISPKRRKKYFIEDSDRE